ncbi:MAG: UbiH/UbiF/VisC/COQ6 family ubiquinone biosynthesis hydroxylase [Idiomarina sp.]
MSASKHILVVGAGLIGLSCALGLRQRGCRVTLVEQGARPNVTAEPGLRVSALNHASRTLLQELGVWQQLPLERLGPYTGMQVWEHNSFADIAFHAGQIGTDDLGAIVENQVLEQALWDAAEQAGVSIVAETKVQQWQQSHEGATLQLGNQQLQGDYVIAADGVRSQLRSWAELPLTFWNYEQRGLVAVIATELPHQGVARQAFLPTGPLALLPLADPHLCSMVWSCDEELAQTLVTLQQTEPEQFRRRLQVASNGILGNLSVASELASFPLQMQYAQQWVHERLILVGDAAHSIHPLAGQGANLGFADVTLLIEAFSATNQRQLNRSLQAYQRERKAAALTMIAAMEAFKRGFGNRQPLLQLLRGAGFALANKTPPLKRWLTKVALGEV